MKGLTHVLTVNVLFSYCSVQSDEEASNILPAISEAKQWLQREGGVMGCGEGVLYLTSPGRPTDIGLQLGKTCLLSA